MAKIILSFLFILSFEARANLFEFSSNNPRLNKLEELVKKLKSLEIKDETKYEESFNQSIKSIEETIEQEKLFCTGELQDSEGRTLPQTQRQVCMRELKKQYIEATDLIFELKKKYLEFIHQKQIKSLNEIKEKTKSEIEKNF